MRTIAPNNRFPTDHYLELWTFPEREDSVWVFRSQVLIYEGEFAPKFIAKIRKNRVPTLNPCGTQCPCCSTVLSNRVADFN